jgi:predicted RNA-binding Zn ribbon-like protein
VKLDSYADAGVLAAVELVNEVVPADRDTAADEVAAVRRVLAEADPPSAAQFGAADAPGFVALAHDLHSLFALLQAGEVDAVAARLNHLLATHPSHPQLAKEGGEWRLHHHPVDAALLPMWTAICAEGLARMIGLGRADRLGTCGAPGCGRVFVDVSKNASRTFCSTTCQNRVKSAAFRRRRDAPTAPG